MTQPTDGPPTPRPHDGPRQPLIVLFAEILLGALLLSFVGVVVVTITAGASRMWLTAAMAPAIGALIVVLTGAYRKEKKWWTELSYQAAIAVFAASAVGLALVAVLVGSSGARNQASSQPARNPVPQPPLPTPSVPKPVPRPRFAEVSATIGTEGACDVAVGEDSVWVSGYHAVTRIDPASNHVLATIDLEGAFEWICSCAVGAGAVWASNNQSETLFRIDPATLSVKPIRVSGGPGQIAIGDQGLWVLRENAVSRVDFRSNAIASTIKVRAPSSIAVSDSGVWVASSDNDMVFRIDPSREEVVATIKVGDKPSSVAVGKGAVWVTNMGENTVSRIEQHSNRVSATIAVGAEPEDIATHSGSVWVVNQGSHTVSRISATTNRVVETIDAGLMQGLSGHAIVVGEGAVWVTEVVTWTLRRIEIP